MISDSAQGSRSDKADKKREKKSGCKRRGVKRERERAIMLSEAEADQGVGATTAALT